MRIYSFITVALIICSLQACTQTPTWKGKLVYGFSASISSYTFSNKTDKILFAEGEQPFVAANGDIYFLNLKFPKVKELIKKYTPAGQFKNILDMSSDNPAYKAAIDDYSFIRGTGISGILYGMSDARISPDSKYISMTIYGGSGRAFTKNCVAVFDIATKTLVKQFDDKYYPNWTKDGQLIMCGTHKNASVNQSTYDAKTPGIFITDKSLEQLQRIDPELDDPSPYHATVSPDATKVAYILNGHVWVMDINGKNNHQLTDIDRDNEETYPVFSPDSKFVACWSYKSFERSYFTAIAIVPVNAKTAVALTDKALVWPRDLKNKRISGGAGQLNWLK
ncbi:MAG TPA: hypothetical protein VLR49_00975 [Ferruginibacter sp.]|nr:hypothetical protein [Ferruginibacter sp.]